MLVGTIFVVSNCSFNCLLYLSRNRNIWRASSGL